MINTGVTWKDIVRANENIRTTDIKGKEYAEVNQRVKAFRMLYPEGTIQTELLKLDGGVCVIQATVSDYDTVLGTGIAYEVEGSTFINKTSYIENCETSAIGRALGMCGFGIDTSVASYEEVQTAIINQELQKNITKVQAKSLKELANGHGVTDEQLFERYKVKRYGEITTEQYADAILWLDPQ